jgi:DNA-binding NtrC family response regulator
VGKEVIAQAIRSSGPRAQRPFVVLNAAALPETVLESELFGHERGAFTGATERRIGVFELASAGTLFLDEVGELVPAIQAKLLRALETGEIRRLGGNETIRVDVRLIAATNRDLRREVKERLFREDLFYRLAVVELRVPPLRERPEDLEPLIRHLLASFSKDPKQPIEIAPQASSALRAYSFPGNVRELRNILESAVNFCEGGVIRLEDLPPLLSRPTIVHDDFPSLATVERDHIESALRRARWNKSRAAALLAIDRKTLYGKIQTYGLRPEIPVAAEGAEMEVAPSIASSTE